jgi:hypothetical protein
VLISVVGRRGLADLHKFPDDAVEVVTHVLGRLAPVGGVRLVIIDPVSAYVGAAGWLRRPQRQTKTASCATTKTATSPDVLVEVEGQWVTYQRLLPLKDVRLFTER